MGSGTAATAFEVTGRARSVLSLPQAEREPGHCTTREPAQKREWAALQWPHTRVSQRLPTLGNRATRQKPGRGATHGTRHSIDPLSIPRLMA